MDYRDERDALRVRIENLEGALATAQADVERLRATEAALETSKREVMRLRAELDRLRPNQPPTSTNRGLGLLIGAGLVVMAIAFGAWFSVSRSDPPPIQVVAAIPEVTVVPPPEPPPPPQKPVAAPPRVAPARRSFAPSRSARAEWTASVTRSQGAAVAPGAVCKVFADLSGDGTSARVEDVEVTCGGKALYRSSDEFSGMSDNSANVTEAAGKATGTARDALTYRDQGARTGRAQISLDTTQRAGVVWSDNIPTFRVEFQVEPWSLERTGEPLVDPENRRELLTESTHRTGKVTTVEGQVSAGVAAGSACTVDVTPAQNGESNCRVRVRCGGPLLYGEDSSGYNLCSIRDGRALKASDPRPKAEDGDPALDMDLSENTIVVSDGEGDTAWKVHILLTPQ